MAAAIRCDGQIRGMRALPVKVALHATFGRGARGADRDACLTMIAHDGRLATGKDRMRARLILVALALLAPQLAGAADLRPAVSGSELARGIRAHAYARYAVAPPRGPIVVAPPAVVLVVPPDGPQPGLLYAPPPVPNPPPPLITAIPIIGPYLIPPSLGPPPATILDAYDHRTDYNQ